MKKQILETLKADGFEVRINESDFVASSYKYDFKTKIFYCVCYELLEGRWEGFIGTSKTGKQ